ncbi:uncharacterized protein [Physcomitrium patens]|uniref:uncharacterized protein isoform X4 n=1 Tax=Physcomitrium patens TaxID=3218 RepID=UPI003CCD003A
MGFQRQGRGTWPMGISVFAHGDQEVLDILRPSLGYSRMYDGGRSDQIGLRAGSDLKNSSTVARVKRASHSWRLEERNSQITSEFNAAKGHIATTDHIEVDRRDDSQKALLYLARLTF